jgi:hypothetical protein
MRMDSNRAVRPEDEEETRGEVRYAFRAAEPPVRNRVLNWILRRSSAAVPAYLFRKLGGLVQQQLPLFSREVQRVTSNVGQAPRVVFCYCSSQSRRMIFF